MRPPELPSERRRSFAVPAVLTVAALGMTAALVGSPDVPFERYFGDMPPLLAVALAAVLGMGSLALLEARAGFAVYRGGGETLRGVGVAALLATVLGGVAVAGDLAFRFPETINVPLPEALLFYPAIAFVVECVFHALPPALLLAGARLFSEKPASERLVWGCLLVTALLEPMLQIGFEADPTSGRAVFVGVHVFAINLLQLAVFRRYDFVSMLALRLVYYLHWHLLWGVVRLEVLF